MVVVPWLNALALSFVILEVGDIQILIILEYGRVAIVVLKSRTTNKAWYNVFFLSNNHRN